MLDDIHSQAARTKEWWDAKTVLRLLGPQSDSSVPQTDGGAGSILVIIAAARAARCHHSAKGVGGLCCLGGPAADT